MVNTPCIVQKKLCKYPVTAWETQDQIVLGQSSVSVTRNSLWNIRSPGSKQREHVQENHEDGGSDGSMDTPSQTECSRKSLEDEVFALRFTVGRDQSYKGGRKAVGRLRGQRSDWEGKGLGMGDRRQCFWDEKTLMASSGNNMCVCGTDRGPSGSLPSVNSGLKGGKLGVRVKHAEVPACSIFNLGFLSCTGAHTSRTN